MSTLPKEIEEVDVQVVVTDHTWAETMRPEVTLETTGAGEPVAVFFPVAADRNVCFDYKQPEELRSLGCILIKAAEVLAKQIEEKKA